MTLPALLVGCLSCEGRCKLVVSDGVTRGREARGVMWRHHRGMWRPKAQAQKQPSSRVTPSKPPATFLGDFAIRKRFITLVTRSLGIVRMSTTTMTRLKRRRHRGHIVYHRRGCRCRWATNVAIRWYPTSEMQHKRRDAVADEINEHALHLYPK